MHRSFDDAEHTRCCCQWCRGCWHGLPQFVVRPALTLVPPILNLSPPKSQPAGEQCERSVTETVSEGNACAMLRFSHPFRTRNCVSGGHEPCPYGLQAQQQRLMLQVLHYSLCTSSRSEQEQMCAAGRQHLATRRCRQHSQDTQQQARGSVYSQSVALAGFRQVTTDITD